MTSLYKETFKYLRANFAAFILIAVLLEALDFAVGYWDMSGAGKLIPQLLILLYFHIMVLSGKKLFAPAGPNGKLPLGHFIWASAILLFGAMIPAFIVAVRSGVAPELVIGVITLVFLPLYFVLLCLLGTSLPAAAMNDQYNPKISLVRARTTWLGIAGGLLISPALIGLIMIASIIVLQVTVGLVANDYGNIANTTLPRAMYGAVIHLTGLYISLSAVVVLCRAYKKVAPRQTGASNPYEATA